MRCEQELLSNMSFVPFGDLLLEPLRNGLTKPKAVRGDGVKMIGMGEIFANSRIGAISMSRVPVTEKELSNNCIKNGDILFARQSLALEGAGKCSIVIDVTEKTVFESHLIRARIDSSKANPYFVYYYFNSYVGKEHIKTIVEQVAAAGIRGSDLVRLKVPCPDLETQDRIAAILSALDEKIAINRAINDNLEQQAQAIYSSMFIDNPDPAWSHGHLSDLITVKYGKDHKKLADGIYPVYGSGGIMRYVERPLYNKESVLIPRKGTLNNVMYVNQPFWSVDTMFYTEMKLPNVAKFVYHFVKAKDLASMNAGSAVPSMTTDILNAMEVVIPSASALEEFESLVAPMYEAMEANDVQSQTLSKMRDTLLPRLMSGEIDVSAVRL